MPAKTLQSVLERHTEVITRFRRQLGEAREPKPAAGDAAVREKERLLETVQGRIQAAREAREATIARIDARITDLEGRAERLEKEIERDRQALDSRRRRPRPPAPPAGPQGRNLTDIQGIGRAYQDRLEAAGIRSADEVARMKPGALAETLSISETRARKLVASAKKVK